MAMVQFPTPGAAPSHLAQQRAGAAGRFPHGGQRMGDFCGSSKRRREGRSWLMMVKTWLIMVNSVFHDGYPLVICDIAIENGDL